MLSKRHIKSDRAIEIARVLIMHGANPDLASKDGRTPRSMAPKEIKELDLDPTGEKYFKMLPDDLVKKIFGLLDSKSLAIVSSVCKRFNELAQAVTQDERQSTDRRRREFQDAIWGKCFEGRK